MVTCSLLSAGLSGLCIFGKLYVKCQCVIWMCNPLSWTCVRLRLWFLTKGIVLGVFWRLSPGLYLSDWREQNSLFHLQIDFLFLPKRIIMLFYFWAYTPKLKAEPKPIFVYLCSQQQYSQQPKSRSNPSINWQMDWWTKCSIYTKLNII